MMIEANTLLLHLTDLHFGDNLSRSLSIPDFSYKDIAILIGNTIKNNYSSKNIVIALGGDITNKGDSRKYQYAIDFINTVTAQINELKISFILCPGNHDIETETENWFGSFNIFSGELTKRQDFIYSNNKTSVLFENHNWSFVATNSLYHGDHKYGLIDIPSLAQDMGIAKYPIILLTHHHLVPILREDTSTTRNAYLLFQLCLEKNVKLIIHGHIHSSFKLRISNATNETMIVGCGAALPEISPNYNNQFNIVALNDNRIKDITSFRIIYDPHDSYKPQIIKTLIQ